MEKRINFKDCKIDIAEADWQVVNNKGKTVDLRIGSLIVTDVPAEETGDYCG